MPTARTPLRQSPRGPGGAAPLHPAHPCQHPGRRAAVGGYNGAKPHPPTAEEAKPTKPSSDKARGCLWAQPHTTQPTPANIPGAEQLQPTLSVGWATHRPKAEFPKTLAEADARMYEMKLNRKREREARERDLGRL